MIAFAVVLVVLILSVCWGKISIDSLNNNPKFSFIKTLIYLCLAIIISVVYYKTTTVHTNYNEVKIDRFNGPVDEKGNIIDIATICIDYRMHIDNIIDSITYDTYRPRGGFEVNVCPYKISNIRKYDSTEVDTIFKILFSLKDWLKLENNLRGSNNAAKISLKEREIYKRNGPEYQEILKRTIDKKNKKSKTDSTILFNALSEILEGTTRMYAITYGTSKTPDFLPYETYEDSALKFLDTSNDILCYHSIEPTTKIVSKNNEITDKKLLREAGLWLGDLERFFVFETNNNRFLVNSNDSSYNHIDYFTAADISQQTYTIRVESDIPLKQLYISFDEPIEISSIYPKPDTVSLSCISYDDSLKLLQVLDAGAVHFHAKFPRYENKQLVRSLILTTILVCIISLFCINAFMSIVTIFNRIKTSSMITKYKKGVKIVAKIFLYLVLMIMLCTIALYILNLFGYTLTFSKSEESKVLRSVAKLLIISGSILFIMIMLIICKEIISHLNIRKLCKSQNKKQK